MAKLSDKNIIPPLSFLENWKKCPWKKSPDCIHLWVNFFIRNVVLTVSWRKTRRNVYWSALVSRNLLCLEKFVVALLHEEITLKFMSQTKENCDSLVLSRSYLRMVWRCHGILSVHRHYFCLEPTSRKGTWIRTTSVTVMVI